MSESHKPPHGDSESSSRPPQGEETGQDPRFEIDWFDEGEAPTKGRLLSEPRPEAPPQPFEIIRDHPREAKSVGGDSEPRPSPAGRPAAGWRKPPPPLWVRLVWGTMPMLLLLGGYASVVLTQSGYGYSWDEAYYYQPAMDAADWVIDTVRGQRPLDRASVDAAWELHHEHPSVQKLLSGLCIRLYPDPARHLYAMRLPMAILFGLSLVLIYMLGRRAAGTWPGLLAAVAYATLPRIFGHAHFAALETPLIFASLLLVFCFLRGLDSALWSVLTGLSFGLLLATKINGFFIPVPLVIWAHLYARQRYVNNLFSMLTLGPLTLYALWPWLWFDPAPRLLDYLRFHAEHQETALFFMGQRWGYGSPNAPWFYPLVMIGVTMPLTSLALAAWGCIRAVFGLARRPYAVLFLLMALVQLAVACAPGTPRYDGVRLFLSVFPFLALLAGMGFASLMGTFERQVRRGRVQGSRRRLLRVAAVTLVLLDGVVAIVRYHPHTLSYFNPVVGGLEGAEHRGFETTYWGETLNDKTIEELNAALPADSSIKLRALHELAILHLQHWDRLDPSLRFEGPGPHDYHLIQMRRGLFSYDDELLVDSGQFPIVHSWGWRDVDLLRLYATGPEFDVYRARMKQQRAAGSPQ